MDITAGAAQAFLLASIWACVGLLGAVPTLLLFRWWSEGILGAVEAIGLVAGYIIVFAMMMGPASPEEKTLLGIVLAAVSGWMIYMATVGRRRSVLGFEQEQEEVFRGAVAANPANVAARCELAMNLHRQARMSEAIEELERAVKMSPATTQSERNMLESWRREQTSRPVATMNCRWCREETPRDRERCVHCGRPTSAVREVLEEATSDIPGTVRRLLVVFPILLAFAFLFSMLQAFAANLMMFILVVAAMWWLRSRL